MTEQAPERAERRPQRGEATERLCPAHDGHVLDASNETLEPIEIRPKKTHISVRLVALVWVSN